MTLCFFHAKPGEPTSLWLWNIFWNIVGGIESSILLAAGAAGPDCGCFAIWISRSGPPTYGSKRLSDARGVPTAIFPPTLFAVGGLDCACTIWAQKSASMTRLQIIGFIFVFLRPDGKLFRD